MPPYCNVVRMRIITAEYFEYQKLASSYDFPFHEIDPRASVFDEDLYQELIRKGNSNYSFTDALRHLAYELPEDRVPELPTRQDVLDLMATNAEKRQERRQLYPVPDDIALLIADMRVFSNYVMSPEAAKYCRSKRDIYIAMEDKYKGRWLWHMLEEIPLLGDDAEELSIRIRSDFYVERRGKDLVLRDYRSEITFRDATVSGPIQEKLRILFAEVYLEDGGWTICTTDGPGKDLDIHAQSFEVRDIRKRKW